LKLRESQLQELMEITLRRYIRDGNLFRENAAGGLGL
jgi:hypothetical protein